MATLTVFTVLVALLAIGAVRCEDETIGPIFMKEPPNRVDFSNTTGAVVECAARGSPAPDVIWVRADGTAVGDVPGLRQVLPNGNLVFPPFRAEDYRQEVHAQVYACLARNPVGTIHSRDVNVRAVVSQHYDTDVNKEYVIMGNSIILKCQVPSFVADFIEVLSWHTDEKEDFYPGENYVVQQEYESEVNNEYVIRGNSAILKCSIPSFVADFVYVISWHDEQENSFTINGTKEGDVVNQFYEAEILTEYVIRGNAAVLKCSIPSFVADFVKVEAWIDEEGTVISHSEDLVVSQYYVTEAENEYVIRGNAAIVHCKIPSFVSDFVYVESWILDDGQILTINNTNLQEVVSQPYEAEADNEYVIRGNAAIMKCEVPSFVSDFVFVEMWTDSDGAVMQVYEARVNDEFVLRGNTAILKCIVPSFVADFVSVVAWTMDNDTVTASENLDDLTVVHQNYEPRVIDEDVLRGNSAIMKCIIPSFVSDYVQVVEWVTEEESLSAFSLNDSEGNYVVSQAYTVNLVEENVLRGNAAIFKCLIPSFVTEYVHVSSWIISEGDDEYEIKIDDTVDSDVVTQAYTVNLMEESVLRGNAAILKCHISTFVTEYVSVSSWIISEGDSEELEIQAGPNDLVVSQAYTVNLMEENVLRGNSAIVKCHIPSFVAEYVTVSSWLIFEGDVEEKEINSTGYTNLGLVFIYIKLFVVHYSCPYFFPECFILPLKSNKHFSVVSQSYTVNLWEENVLRGNSAILKCHIPSFVTEYVAVTSWIISEGEIEEMDINLDSDSSLVVSQAYDVKFWEEYVLRGNAAVLKCQIPSFVSEYVSVISWIISEDENEQEVKIDESSELVVSQAYAVNLMEEYVLRGNSAILKCHIPSFVSEYVSVISWIISEGDEIDEIKLDSEQNLNEGKYLVLPSGELHIRDVGPEDGYKSYQCRTKHRLTGETRLSATKGRLVITEPIGRVQPKFSSSQVGAMYVATMDTPFSLQCPAQAFPVPVFRANGKSITEISIDGNRTKFHVFIKHMRDVTLPSPSISYSVVQNLYLPERHHSLLLHRPIIIILKLLPAAPCFAKRKGTLNQCSEPTNKIAPRKDSAQNFEGWEVFLVAQNDVAYLKCQVAAYPAPLFRWYKFIDGTARKQPVVLNDRVKQVSGTLIIKEAKVEDSGKYLCVVNNSVGGESVETVLTVTAPLKATVEPATQTVDFGRPAVFTCRYEGNPVKTITWLKDGKDMNHHDPALRIESVKKEDKGMYQCFIRNDQESAGASAELKLGGRFEPPQIRHSFSEQTLRSGPSLRLKCVASGNPTPDIAWQLDGDKLNSGERLQIGQFVTADGNVESHLNISSVHTNDGGLYSCIASSKVGSASHSSRVNVYGLPYVRPMKKRPVVAGDTLIAHCPVAGYPIDSIVWERDGRVLPINRKQKVFPNGTLVIENVERMSDQATYTCVAKNSQGYSARGQLELQVMVPPQILPFEFGDEPANAGDMASISCAVIPPQITPFEFGEEVLNEGETASVSCVMSKGDLPVTFKWRFNGEIINSHNTLGIVLTTISKKTSILNIEAVNAVHRGSYTCEIRNAAGQTNHTTLLSVNVLPQIHPFTFGDEPANAGDTVGLQCMVTKGDAPINITWYLNGKPMINVQGVTVAKIGHKSSSLSIDAVSFVHTGVYTCSATNQAGHANYSTDLVVNVVPQVTPFDFGEETLNAGDTVSLTCTVGKGDLPLKIHWQLNNAPLNSGNGVFINRNGKRISVLSIENVQHEHIGNYTCIAENEAGSSTHSALLNVNVMPQIMPFDFGTDPVNDQEMMVVICSVTKGDLPLTIRWYFNGIPLKSETNGVTLINSKRTSQLTIESVSHHNQGNYTCSVKNQAGSANHTAELYVNVPPQIIPFEFGEDSFNAQEMVLVTCTVSKVAPIITPFDFDESVFFGEGVQVMCHVPKGDTPLNFKWTFSEGDVSSLTGINIINAGDRGSVLIVGAVTAKHSGNYTCTASNTVAKASHHATLNVKVAPIISPFEFDEAVFYGESIQVMCHTPKGDTPIDFTWFFRGKPIQKKDAITITKVGARSSILVIPSVTEKHSGNYSCTASNIVAYANHTAALHVQVPPHIVPFEAEEPVFAGESVQLNCHVSKGDTPLTITWSFHGKELSSHEGITTTKIGQRTSLLTIMSAMAGHSGEYSCHAANHAGLALHSTSVNVHVLPYIVPFEADESVFAGESVQLNCHVSKGDLPLDIKWHFHGFENSSSHLGIMTTKMTSRTSFLSIVAATASHSGNYTCVATNSAGSTNHSTVLNVHVVPYINPFEVEESIFAGESVHLTCHVSKGDRPLEISWSFQGVEIPYHNNMGITTTKLGEKASVLSIPTAMGQHSGNYTCTASNRAGRAHHSAVVNIHVPPHIMPFEIEESIYYGESVQMTCHASKGDRPMSISWTFEGQDLSTHTGIKTMKMAEQTSFLSIASVTGAHSGNYTCIAKNRAGEDRYSTSLHVKVVPHIKPFELDEAVFAGESVHLDCHVPKGDIPLTISWSFQGQYITRRLGVKTTKLSERVSVLDIPVVTDINSGNYTCTASNKAGNVNHTVVLNVIVPPNILPFSFGEKPANVGEYLQVACTVNFGDLPLTITWTFNSQLISQRNNNYLISNSKRSSLLIIESVDDKHAGSYTCIGENRAGRTTYSADLVVYVPPKIAPFSFGPEPAYLGDYFALQCIITHGDQPVKIEWTLNNQSARGIPGVRLSNNDRRSSVLTIESIAATHAGVYNCTAKNAGGVVSYTTELVVRVPPLIVPFTFGDIPSNPGDAVVVNCVATKGDMPLDISWTFSSETIDSNMHRDITTTPLGPRASVLTINSVSANHQGNYTCIVQNAAGRAEHAATLVVNVLPRIVPFSFETPLYAGQATQVTCLISEGDLPIDIQWYFEEQPLKELAEVTATKIAKRASLLLIDPAGWSNTGIYTCLARNAAGSSNYSASLEVHVPPRWILEPTDKAFAQGSDAKVECKADGFPKPQVTWKRAEGDTPGDYKDLKPNNPNVKVEDGTLTVSNIQKTNEGYYLCEAVNGIGSGLSAVILISVQAPPQFEIKMRNQTARRSEPAVLQCQAKGEKPIGIIWNMNNKRLEPKSDPRYTIREEILPGGVVSDLSIRRTERSDSALFTCVATNAFGSDDTSINMIIQEVPEAPYGLKVLDKSGRTVQLSWAAPYDGNSPIKKFLIEYKRAKGNWEKDIDRVLVPGDATEAGVFSLRPATAYHIRIVAENELGTSEPSETVTIITAEEAPTGMPQDVKVDAADKHTLRVTWKPPPPQDWNGELQGYYVGYKLASSNKSFVFETVDISKESGKEHHLDILNLKTYTQYSIVVQAFNKMGSGPVSNEVRAYTAEGAPSAPPQDVLCTTLTAQTIRVSWVSPPLAAANGLIKAYKVIYGPSETWYDEKTKDTKITASSETILHGLKKFTNYSMEVLATTNGGDGVRSAPIHCQTEQDVPEAPRAVKAVVMGADSILVSWRPPAQPNGVVTHYNVYTQAQNAEPHPNKVPASQTSYSATELKAGRYDFWVTASTIIGEGQPSATASCSPSDKVPAKIASFDESFTATYKEDVKLPCLAVGVPPPNILWKVKGHPLEASERVRQLPEGSLQIAGVAREDAGEYSCHVENQFGTDTVTHTLSVLAPPFPPQLSIASSSVSSLTLRLKPPVDADQSAAGYTIHYKQEFGDWETVQIPSNTDTYTLENLFCGSRYQLYVTAYNGIGTGEASDVVIARTRGSKPPVPRAADFIEVGSSSVTLHLKQWLDGGCPMSHFVVENKKKGAPEWNQISNAVKPGGNFVVLDLEPATWYVLRITAHNNAGFNVAEYEFATLTMTGGTIAPVRDVGDGSLTPEQTFKIILSHLNLIVPVVAAILVIIIAIVVVCVVRGARDHHHKAWLEPEVLVPILATIVVFIVGMVVICLTLARRNTPHRLRDDAVYNASQAALGGGGGTLDKRGGLRDELGYIAPPNRKLPPVPGSNYNTCDRVKRQAVIMGAHSTWDPRRHHYERVRRTHMRRAGSGDTLSTGMEDEICPYATFHLLGFREEMDPSKAIAFPHHHPSHAGTLAHPHPHPHHPAHSRAGSQSMPRANSRYARKNSQGGQSAIYSTAPEYDDPATCAEEDQYRARYSRPMYACGPEYDEPACCAPEDEQYTGAYGTPYSDHYGSRPSIGTRKCGGSPSPPPPPPRNATADNNCSSSFNESKDSNEISEAECDQPRNYPVRAHTAKDGLHTEEMRKLIDRPEANTPIPQQAIHGRGLTAYDTVAV
ncbi:unnamed protein product [Colias eurytheme]|nr:unnamed protein product [Colias eurytheme]